MSHLTPAVLRCGREGGLPERLALRAGPLSLVYEEADLRYIRLADAEVLRRIYVGVRDQSWGTIPPLVSRLELTAQDDSFEMSFHVEHRRGPVDFAWEGTIKGAAEGTVEFVMDGVARSTFLSSRVGICVLHPIRECAGRPCTVEHVDGTITRGAFPCRISPHQPFTDIRAIRHEVADGVAAEARFDGAVFEMEDQRNWTDESYKTYSPPLRLPFPVEVKEGTRVRQSVSVTIQGRRRRARRRKPDLTLALDEPTGMHVPRIGLGTPASAGPLTDTQQELLKRLNLAHLRSDLRLFEPGCEAALRRAWADAEALGVPLEAAVFVSDAADRELAALRALLERLPAGWRVATWLIFHRARPATTHELATLARRHLGSYDAAARIGGGTNGNFAELNRNRPPVDALDVVSFSANPQVHAFDNASLVEALQGQRWAIESARQFIGTLPLAIGPVTLRPRARRQTTEPAPDELPADVDERQMSLFGAAWTVGSLKQLSEGGVHSATYYETIGWLGVMEAASGCPLPQKFRSLPGCVFPVYHVFADVGEFCGAEVVRTTSSGPLLFDGLAMRRDGRTRLLLAGLSPDACSVTVRGIRGPAVVRRLDETNAEAAMLNPKEYRARPGEAARAVRGALKLDLPPYAVVTVDVTEG
jgi:hypothetical protein